MMYKGDDSYGPWRAGGAETTEDEMAGWRHRRDGPELEQTGQGSLAYYSPWGHKELDVIL